MQTNLLKPKTINVEQLGPNKAKVLVSDPRYRARQEKPAKGKGSYRREAFQSRDWEASYFLAA